MKVVSIGILSWNPDSGRADPTVLDNAHELSEFGYFQRGSVKEMLVFISRTIVKRTPPGGRQSVQHEGLGGIVVTDMDYPGRVAFAMLNKLLDEFEAAHSDWQSVAADNGARFPRLQAAVVEMQDPARVDKITQINRTLDETKEEVVKTIDSILERGAKLDELVDQSEDLSRQSKMFYKQAKKTNSCCTIM